MSLKCIEYLWFSRININNRLKNNLLKEFGTINEFYNCSLDDLIYFNIRDKDIQEILNIELRDKLVKEYEFLNKNNIGILSFEDEKYPEKLRKIEDCPKVLYYKGNINILENESVGIIGARVALNKSLEKAREIAMSVATLGINVVSGLARGIDKFAHLGCIDANVLNENKRIGKTIAVLGSGIDDMSFYPKENYKVFERILENDGCVLSEYPVGTEPKSINFPYRNRIISGLSDKIIIVQAGMKSGSLITVDYALDQGKDILVIEPFQNVNFDYFKGNIELINQGAKIYKNIEDLLLN